jgi:hypothetical protein
VKPSINLIKDLIVPTTTKAIGNLVAIITSFNSG